MESTRTTIGLKRLVEREGARGLTIRCFDLIKDQDVTGCLGVSRLLDSGIVAGCERDIPATITMLILSELSGKPTWMANIVNVGENQVEIAHCTIATTPTTSYTLTTHFESEKPTGIAGVLEEGVEVTLAKYDPKKNLLRTTRGIVKTGKPVHSYRCRRQATIEVPREYTRRILEDPMGAHIVLAIGDYLEELEQLATLINTKTEIYR